MKILVSVIIGERLGTLNKKTVRFANNSMNS